MWGHHEMQRKKDWQSPCLRVMQCIAWRNRKKEKKRVCSEISPHMLRLYFGVQQSSSCLFILTSQPPCCCLTLGPMASPAQSWAAASLGPKATALYTPVTHHCCRRIKRSDCEMSSGCRFFIAEDLMRGCRTLDMPVSSLSNFLLFRFARS